MGNALILALQLLQLVPAAAQAGEDISELLTAGTAKVQAAQQTGVDLTDDDLQAEMAKIVALSEALNVDPPPPAESAA